MAWLLQLAYMSSLVAFNRRYKPQDLELGHIEQIETDWTLRTFTDLHLTNETYCPSSHPDEFIFHVYPGVTHSCNCIGRDGTVFRDIYCDKGKNGRHNVPECWDQKAHPAIVQAQINGVRVCAKREGTPYVDVQRSVSLAPGGECPETHIACPGSASSDAANLICVLPNQSGLCPITGV